MRVSALLIWLLLLSTAAEANCKGMRGCVSEADAAKRNEEERRKQSEELAKQRQDQCRQLTANNGWKMDCTQDGPTLRFHIREE